MPGIVDVLESMAVERDVGSTAMRGNARSVAHMHQMQTCYLQRPIPLCGPLSVPSSCIVADMPHSSVYSTEYNNFLEFFEAWLPEPGHFLLSLQHFPHGRNNQVSGCYGEEPNTFSVAK